MDAQSLLSDSRTGGTAPGAGPSLRWALALLRAATGAELAWVAWTDRRGRAVVDWAGDGPQAAALARRLREGVASPERLRSLATGAEHGLLSGPSWRELEDALRGEGEWRLLGAPLATPELSGVLLLARSAGAFVAADEALLLAAAPAWSALVGAVLAREEVERLRHRLGTLVAMLAALDPRASPEAVASAAARVLRQLFEADRCVITRLRGDAREVIGIDSTFADDDAWVGAVEPAGDLGWLGLEGDPGYRVVADLRAEPAEGAPRYLRAALEAGVRAVVRARLGDAGAPLGIVSLASRQPGFFADADGEALERLARPLALALRLAEAREKAERSARRAAAANRLLAEFARASSGEELCRRLLTGLRDVFAAAYAEAVWLPHRSGEPRFHASCEWMDEEGLRRVVGEHGLGAHDVTIVDDAREEETGHALHGLLVLQGLRSAIRVPLLDEGRVAGHLAVWSPQTHAYGEEELRLLESLAAPAALGLARLDAERARAASEAKYRLAIAQAQQLVLLLEPKEGRVVEANDFAARTLGYASEELAGLPLASLCASCPEELAANLRELVESGGFVAPERRFRRRDGSEIVVDVVASRVDLPDGETVVAVFGRDVSDRLVIQRQLVQAQKMESLGQMAGMVAHDFNNILTAILGFASMLKRSPRLNRDEQESVALIEQAARRAADLSGRLLAFSRGGLVRYGLVDLREVVRDTLRLAEPALQRLHVEVSLPASPMLVEGDEGQLQQAVLNILLNSRDAMPEGGTVRIEGFVDGETASLAIADDGPGMDEETRARAFEPFFTTKPPGQGTGLGLAIVYGVVQAHKGRVAVESAPGAGTAFLISLPLATAAPQPEPRGSVPVEGDLILVVDDDELVRRTAGSALAHLGFTAVEAANGRTAIEVVRARPERFRAVLLDLVMPGLTGADTFRAIRAIRPDLPVIVCTGYAAESHLDDELRRAAVAVLQKPFTPERLQQALERAGLAARRRLWPATSVPAS